MQHDVKSVIDKLIYLTKGNKAEWQYLDQYPTLADKSKTIIRTAFVPRGSFYINISNGYMVLYEAQYSNSIYLHMIAFPTIDAKDVQALNTYSECQEDILRLQNLVKKQFPNVDDFLDNILSDS